MFGIDEDNVITYVADGEPPGSAATFGTKRQLAAVVKKMNWSKADVAAVWNANAGKEPFSDLARIKKFDNRPQGINRIWAAIQRLKGEAGEGAEKNGEAEKPAKVKKAKAPKATKADRKPRAPKSNAQVQEVTELLKRREGVTVAELVARFKWGRPETARGFLSRLRSDHGVKIETEKVEGRGRVYKATA